MEVVIRPIPHSHDEYAMGHCIFWPSAGADAISCTYNLNGFTPMTAVIREMGSTLPRGVDIEHFRKCARYHDRPNFRTIGHGDEKPLIITATKTERWDSEPGATNEILTIADAEQCESLCMTHFMFILGKFPETAFEQCLRSIELPKFHTQLRKIVVDVDERCYLQAIDVHTRVRKNANNGPQQLNS